MIDCCTTSPCHGLVTICGATIDNVVLMDQEKHRASFICLMCVDAPATHTEALLSDPLLTKKHRASNRNRSSSPLALCQCKIDPAQFNFITQSPYSCKQTSVSHLPRKQTPPNEITQ
jgi:hypothetical protein